MQVFSKLLALALFWGLAAIPPAAAQTTSQKQWQNERPPDYRFPRMPRDGPVPFLSASRAEITKRTASAAQDSNTTLIGSWIGGPCDAVAVAGTRAYFGNGPYLVIADVSDPGKPTELGRILLPDAFFWGVAVSGNFVYVAAEESGLRIIDVSDPASPNEVGFLVTGSRIIDVAVSGNYAYLADYFPGGLRIIDVSDPANPTEIGFFDSGAFTTGVAVSGDHTYLAHESNGLRIIDVSDPARPFEVGFFRYFRSFYRYCLRRSGQRRFCLYRGSG